MKDYVILTDSTSDLSKELRDELNVDYCPMNVVVNVGKDKEEEIPADLDWGKYSFHDFYNLMRQGVKMKTTAVPQNVFEEKFKKALDEGKDVLYIACSGALSGSINIARMIAKELLESYPDSKIICVDSLVSCAGEGLLVKKASELRSEGKSIEEVRDYLEANKLKYNQFATVETLTYLKNAGRIKASKAFFGNLIGVKPILLSDKIGQNYAYIKVKGRRPSLDKVVEDTKNALEDLNNAEIWITHADCQNDVDYIVEKIKAEINPSSIKVLPMGPIIGVSTGPGTIGVFFVGKEVTVVGE
ncbi:MAG: DegV family protein [Bacillales bacterium]|nr:DegV family protein [Bacillales bacterium]